MKRVSKTKLNITSAVLLQLVTGICGLILHILVYRHF